MTHGPTGVIGLVPVFPDKHVEGEQARRFDFLYDRLRNKSLKISTARRSKSLIQFIQ